jgi:hypothetical protein
MIIGVTRKIRQFFSDTTLRKWVFGRMLGRWPGTPKFNAHRPLYAKEMLPLSVESPTNEFSILRTGDPSYPLEIELAGKPILLNPDDYGDIYRHSFQDVEVLLALHRFAWVPMLGDTVDPAWVNNMWLAWRRDFATPSDHLAWHPYTAAERAINILHYTRLHGLPGDENDTINILAAHAPVIADRLEYFGDHHTSNHLSNNGRGLYVLGLELGLEKATILGAQILLSEFDRIFSSAGILREGSSHYQLLLARNYVDSWLAAKRHDHKDERKFKKIAEIVLSGASLLKLPGGFPKIGDISPDCPPAYLECLISEGFEGWIDGQSNDDRVAFKALQDHSIGNKQNFTLSDGWLRWSNGSWTGLWYVSPNGWCAMPGHSHQDIGSFEIHFLTEPVIVDPGRGAYGETGDAALYRSGKMHSGLQIDDTEPYPKNRPYYSAAFRKKIGGPPPTVEQNNDQIKMTHSGYSRLPNCGRHERTWRIRDDKLTLTDNIFGSGRHAVSRTIITPLEPKIIDGYVLLQGRLSNYKICCDTADIVIQPITCWLAYGRGEPAFAINFKSRVKFPFIGAITMEPVGIN